MDNRGGEALGWGGGGLGEVIGWKRMIYVVFLTKF